MKEMKEWEEAEMAKKSLSPRLGGLRSTFSLIIVAFLALIVIIAISLTRSGILLKAGFVAVVGYGSERCDLFSGSWVYNNSTYPLYSEKDCMFMSDQSACEKFGRKNLKYQNWRWQPHGCDLPRFNASRLLEKLTGKRLAFVGDSLSRKQWVSMVCLLGTAFTHECSSFILACDRLCRELHRRSSST